MAEISFSGGEELQRKLQELLGKLPNETLRVGFLEGSTCGQNNQASAPNVAAILEYGSIHMPARPFFERFTARTSPEWAPWLVKLSTAYDHDMHKALGAMGEKLKQELVQEIIDFNDPPDSPETLRRKAFKGGVQATLQDSKNLMRAVDYDLQVNGQKVTP